MGQEVKSNGPRIKERTQDEQQDPDQAEKEGDKASTGGISSLDFNFLSDIDTYHGDVGSDD